jgi:hypothetical protein
MSSASGTLTTGENSLFVAVQYTRTYVALQHFQGTRSRSSFPIALFFYFPKDGKTSSFLDGLLSSFSHPSEAVRAVLP